MTVSCQGCNLDFVPETDVVVDALVVRHIPARLGEEHGKVFTGPDHGFFHPACWFEPDDRFQRERVGLLATLLDEIEPGWR